MCLCVRVCVCIGAGNSQQVCRKHCQQPNRGQVPVNQSGKRGVSAAGWRQEGGPGDDDGDWLRREWWQVSDLTNRCRVAQDSERRAAGGSQTWSLLLVETELGGVTLADAASLR